MECVLSLIPRDADVWVLSSTSAETVSINGSVTGEKVVTGNARGVIWGWVSHCVGSSVTCFVSGHTHWPCDPASGSDGRVDGAVS